MKVSLTPELESWGHGRVKSCLCNSASEVVPEGLRLLKDREQQKEALRKSLKSELRAGIAQLETGLSQELTESTVERIKASGRVKLN